MYWTKLKQYLFPSYLWNYIFIYWYKFIARIRRKAKTTQYYLKTELKVCSAWWEMRAEWSQVLLDSHGKHEFQRINIWMGALEAHSLHSCTCGLDVCACCVCYIFLYSSVLGKTHALRDEKYHEMKWNITILKKTRRIKKFFICINIMIVCIMRYCDTIRSHVIYMIYITLYVSFSQSAPCFAVFSIILPSMLY